MNRASDSRQTSSAKYILLLLFRSRRHLRPRGGFAALTTVIFVFAISAIILAGFVFVTLREVKITRNFSSSVRSYYGAESGIEDAVYRHVTGKQINSGEAISTGTATGTITIAVSGPTRTITAEGLESNLYRRSLQAVITTESTRIGFHYGVQIGEVGLTMGNNTKIIGNVFSNGDINGGGSNQSEVTGTAQVSGAHLIKNIKVDGDARAQSFQNCIVYGTATYVTTMTGCTATTTVATTTTLAAEPFPITDQQITDWETDAAAGGTLAGYTIGSNTSVSLGPKKINGNLILGNNVTLTVTGTLWVTGTIQFGNSDTIQLSSAYGALSGMIIVDGSVSIGNTVVLKGSGNAASYLMLLSTYGPGTALSLGNSATGAIFYAPNGTLDIGNGLDLREATADGLIVGNNSTVTYETGLASVDFTSGPTANWVVKSWKEVP
ncbi:MAG: hypothetical protein HYT40_03520 [Candidatus Sungbacteria bacterium]|uniref:Type 4 fimbrial biogenesis protein PilX N-terminal domain-containing protein n=1 Tax=Candidatus Sungiibacteriota bacterium TaxID=2750080 RepID=A0A931SC36_9BACT|nr:hypothetical protein [Candidatus Sungbacteria bacterium]